MDVTENAVASLVELWQRREDLLENAVIDWCQKNLAPSQGNDLVRIVRQSRSALDVKNELTALAAVLSRNA